MDCSLPWHTTGETGQNKATNLSMVAAIHRTSFEYFKVSDFVVTVSSQDARFHFEHRFSWFQADIWSNSPIMRTPYDISVSPITNFEWWNAHVSYSKFRRQGIDIVCASFKQKNAKANVVFVTGLMESFIKYSETIQYLYAHGFNVFTYDHQSQGLSGRCELPFFFAAISQTCT